MEEKNPGNCGWFFFANTPNQKEKSTKILKFIKNGRLSEQELKAKIIYRKKGAMCTKNLIVFQLNPKSKEFIKCRFDNFSMGFILFDVNLSMRK